MPRKVFLDTNYLLDFAIPGRPQHELTFLIEDDFVYGKAQAYVAATSLKDLYYVLSKNLDEPFARKFVSLTCKAYQLVPVDQAICEKALASSEPDFEDGIIRACAESIHADYILSRDEKAFVHGRIKRLSPKDYLDEFAEIATVDLKTLKVTSYHKPAHKEDQQD